MKITFKRDCELEVVESYDEDTDHTETSDATFKAGEIVDADIEGVRDNGTVNIQFADGSMAYGVPKDLLEYDESEVDV